MKGLIKLILNKCKLKSNKIRIKNLSLRLKHNCEQRIPDAYIQAFPTEANDHTCRQFYINKVKCVANPIKYNSKYCLFKYSSFTAIVPLSDMKAMMDLHISVWTLLLNAPFIVYCESYLVDKRDVIKLINLLKLGCIHIEIKQILGRGQVIID